MLPATQASSLARTERLARQTLCGRVRQMAPSDVESLPAVIENPVVQGMKARILGQLKWLLGEGTSGSGKTHK